MAALYGGGLMCWAYGGMSPGRSSRAICRDAISLDDFAIGMIKAPFMGLGIIGAIACVQGARGQGQRRVAQAARPPTRSSNRFFLVILFDGVLAMFFATIGM